MLDPRVAAEFLVGRTGDPDERAALELAGELGGLPLALEQAAAYVQASGESLAGYLSLFRQRRADLLGRGEPTGYSETVATTWRLAFEDCKSRAGRGRAAAAAGVLRARGDPAAPAAAAPPGLTGQLSQEVAPVLVPLLEDPLAANDAIMALRRYSLVTPAGDGSVSVHRLVQAVTAAQLPADLAAGWRQTAALLINAALPDDPELPAAWPVFAALVPHAQAALAPSTTACRR